MTSRLLDSMFIVAIALSVIGILVSIAQSLG
jgi:hypothetical protein